MAGEHDAEVPPEVTFRIEGTDGVEAIVPNTPNSDAVLRVAFGDVSSCSAIWRFWLSPNHNDVYIAVRTLAGIAKWSLHLKTGSWMFQYVREYSEKHSIENRELARMARPPELGGNSGWTSAFAIFTRSRDLAPLPKRLAAKAKDVEWLPAPPAARAGAIHLFIVRPDSAVVELRGMTPFAIIQLPNGDGGMLAVAYPELTPAADAQIEEEKAWAVASCAASAFESGTSPRLALDTGQDGTFQVWDLLVEQRVPD